MSEANQQITFQAHTERGTAACTRTIAERSNFYLSCLLFDVRLFCGIFCSMFCRLKSFILTSAHGGRLGHVPQIMRSMPSRHFSHCFRSLFVLRIGLPFWSNTMLVCNTKYQFSKRFLDTYFNIGLQNVQ